MNRQTAFQAKESAPTKKSSFSLLRQSAVNPVAEAETLPGNAAGGLVVDFTKVPVRPMQLLGVPGFSCPFAPQRCPSGGACHTCPPKLQAKLKIGQPGDQYEQEADRVAETVMRMPEPQVQRKGCSAPGCKEEDEDKKLVQTKPAGGGESRAYVDHPLIQSVLSSPGQPLDAATRSFMEPRFGQDFSGVRVHLGGEAAESARAVNARAYTVGRDVVFGEGQYAPGSDEGRRLVAHELVHVGQQNRDHSLQQDKSILIQRYPVPSELSCSDIVSWLNNNSPYSPEWAETQCSYTFNGQLRTSSQTDTSGNGVKLTVRGHRDLTVSISSPIDAPEWSPSPRANRQAEVLAWRNMKTVLDGHERQHRSIGNAWRNILQDRFRAVNFTVTDNNQHDAANQAQQKVSSMQQQWERDAQAAQDAIDPFRGAILNCP